MGSRLRVALIGCGFWGFQHARVLKQLGVLAAICDINEDLSRQIQSSLNVPAYSYATILSDKKIDAIVIAASTPTHYSLTVEALKAGKHVLVEKPMTMNVKQAEYLCRLADHHRKTLMVGHLLQYHPAFVTLKRIIKEGVIGQLHYIYSNRLNFGRLRTEENILWSFAPHDISLILSLVNEEPIEITAEGSSYLNRENYDITITHLAFRKNIKAHIFVSWLHPYKEHRLVILGEKGMLVFNDGLDWPHKLSVYRGHIEREAGITSLIKTKAEAIEVPQKEPLWCENSHFLECIKNNRRPITDGYEGLRVVKVLEAVTQSYRIKALEV